MYWCFARVKPRSIYLQTMRITFEMHLYLWIFSLRFVPNDFRSNDTIRICAVSTLKKQWKIRRKIEKKTHPIIKTETGMELIYFILIASTHLHGNIYILSLFDIRHHNHSIASYWILINRKVNGIVEWSLDAALHW